MPKKMFVDPEEVRKPGKLSFTDIPMNVYQKPLEQELSEGAFTPEELKTIYHDMYMIRTFEEMLHTIKVLGMYRQHKFSYTGPAHLSIGEEAYAVGEAFLLDENDFIFGSHRGHHEVLAKAMSAIRKIPEEKLLEIMTSYHNGVQYRIVRHRYPNVGVRELAEILPVRDDERDFREGCRLWTRPWRIHACVFHPVWNLSEQCHRGRLRLHGDRRGAL